MENTNIKYEVRFLYKNREIKSYYFNTIEKADKLIDSAIKLQGDILKMFATYKIEDGIKTLL